MTRLRIAILKISYRMRMRPHATTFILKLSFHCSCDSLIHLKDGKSQCAGHELWLWIRKTQYQTVGWIGFHAYGYIIYIVDDDIFLWLFECSSTVLPACSRLVNKIFFPLLGKEGHFSIHESLLPWVFLALDHEVYWFNQA